MSTMCTFVLISVPLVYLQNIKKAFNVLFTLNPGLSSYSVWKYLGIFFFTDLKFPFSLSLAEFILQTSCFSMSQ